MHGSFQEFAGTRIFAVSAQGPELRSGQDAVDLMSAASGQGVAIIAIPISRLGEDFFDLRTRIAGEFIQKFVTYGSRVAIVGDISRRIAASKSLAAFVTESNRGQDLWFVDDLFDLADRLSP